MNRNTKKILSQAGYKFHAVELDQISNGQQVQEYLRTMTGQRTVPNVFINGKHVGGNDKVSSLLASGQLEKLYRDEL